MTTTSMVEEITAKAAGLPFELQREALDFIEFIAQRTKHSSQSNQAAAPSAPDSTEGGRPFKSVLGSLEHLSVHVSLEDLAELRREMWANFPHEELC